MHMVLPNKQSSCWAHVCYFPTDSCCIFTVPHLRNIPEGGGQQQLEETNRKFMHMDYQHDEI